jgi:hypothetical protein
MKTYNLYGVRVASAIDLRGVPLWSSAGWYHRSDSGANADVAIELGDAPTELEAPFSVLGNFQIGVGCVLLRIPGVAWYLIKDGREIQVRTMPQADASLVCRHLLRDAMVALFLQRQIFPIRASAIARQDACIILLGRAGVGKSTLAQAFAARDYGVLADDVVLMSTDGQVVSSLPEFGHAADHLMKIRVRRLYLLRWLLPKSAELEIEPLPAFQAMLNLRKLAYWPSLISAMSCEPAFLALISRLLSSTRADEFRRPACLNRLEAQVETLEQSFAVG